MESAAAAAAAAAATGAAEQRVERVKEPAGTERLRLLATNAAARRAAARRARRVSPAVLGVVVVLRETGTTAIVTSRHRNGSVFEDGDALRPVHPSRLQQTWPTYGTDKQSDQMRGGAAPAEPEVVSRHKVVEV
eukprot:SAG11_NODE_4613_length_1834_cov_4.598847_3_plen_134_part_00